MEIISWARNVNRIVTDESSISVGQGAVVSDQSENGSEMSRLTGSGTPERYQVTMFFSNSATDSFYLNNGKTEWQAFLDWFKYESCMGTKPFYFHHLSDPNNTTPQVYKISTNGIPTGSPNGEYIKCTMQWIQIFNGFITIPVSSDVGDSISVVDGQIDFRFTEEPNEIPKKEDFYASYQISNNGVLGSASELVIEQMDWDGYKTCILYFQNLENAGLYHVTVNYKDSALETNFLIGE